MILGVAYFLLLAGLVVLGSGGSLGPAALAYVVLLVGCGAAISARPLGGEGRVGSPPQRGLFHASLALLGALHYALPRAEAAGWGVWAGAGLQWVGVAMFAAGMGLRLWGMIALGRFFSYHLTVQDGHAIVRGGPYRWIRHPAYAGFLLSLAGFGLVFRSFAGIVLPALFLPVILWTIAREEAVLARAFGDAFAEYRRATRKLLPFLY